VFEDAFNKNNLGVLDVLVSPRVVYHNPPPGLASGIEGYCQLLTMWRTAFPDAHVTVEDMIGEADKMVTRFTGRGTRGRDRWRKGGLSAFVRIDG
jgi:predicted ester cyclase